MTKTLKLLIATLAIPALLVACAPPTPDVAIEKMEQRITNKLDLNTEQQQKLAHLAKTIKPVATQAMETFHQSRKKWRETISDSVDKNTDVDPELMTALIDDVIAVYQQNKNGVAVAMADFYNSLDKDQKHKVAKIVKRGTKRSALRGRQHGHGNHEHGNMTKPKKDHS